MVDVSQKNTFPNPVSCNAITNGSSPYASYWQLCDMITKCFLNCFNLVWGQLNMLITQTFFSSIEHKKPNQLEKVEPSRTWCKMTLTVCSRHNITWCKFSSLVQASGICCENKHSLWWKCRWRLSCSWSSSFIWSQRFSSC